SSCAYHASSIWSKFIVLFLGELRGERRLDAVDADPDVALAEAEDLRHVAVGEAVEHQQREAAVDLAESGDPRIDPLEPRIAHRRFGEQAARCFDLLPALAVL